MSRTRGLLAGLELEILAGARLDRSAGVRLGDVFGIKLGNAEGFRLGDFEGFRLGGFEGFRLGGFEGFRRAGVVGFKLGGLVGLELEGIPSSVACRLAARQPATPPELLGGERPLGRHTPPCRLRAHRYAISRTCCTAASQAGNGRSLELGSLPAEAGGVRS